MILKKKIAKGLLQYDMDTMVIRLVQVLDLFVNDGILHITPT